jgi:hypothetical protein
LGGSFSGSGEVSWKGCRRVSMVKKYIHMYVNAKMVLVESIPGMEGG